MRIPLVLVMTLLLAACGGNTRRDDGSSNGQADGGTPETTGPAKMMDRPAYDPGELAGTRWRLISLRGRSPVEGIDVTLRLRQDALRGNSGCNFYGAGRLRTEGEAFEVGPVEMTMIGCKGAVGEQESSYLRALQTRGTYRLREDHLEIRDDSGETVLLFEEETR